VNDPSSRIGVLLANLGSPEKPTAAAVRRYLREFLGDRRVVDAPRALWWLVLNLVILPLRSPRSARLYRSIWSDDGSPLVLTTLRQAEALAGHLESRLANRVEVVAGMRYGAPSIASSLTVLRARGCDRIVVLPLYPQYSATTTASVSDAVGDVMRSWRVLPLVRTVLDYHAHPGYVGALASSLKQWWQLNAPGDRLLVSFHGIPQRYADDGDPYPERCRASASLLAEQLQLDPDRWTLAFQSRFGRGRWLEPSTAAVVAAWGAEGLGSVDVICPGFAADCLETLEEIAVGARLQLEQAGGGRLTYIPALNERPDHIEALADIVLEHMAGWV